MFDLLWLIPAFPFAGFVVLACGAPAKRAAAVIGVGSVGLSALLGIWLAITFIASPPPGQAYSQILWAWMTVADFSPQIGLYLDALSLLMILVVTVVGFLIHLYSVEFMIEDQGYSRYFAYMNLFVGSMLILVLADNLLLLYLGWEGVGLCSYLLIGFWYSDSANGRAARKAFVVTRVGDTAMAIGLFLLFTNLGTLQIQELMDRALGQWPVGSGLAIAAAALLLGGALGKSAQLPLQTWLPDAMAGPTPVSALIHAATMVTAGVYLIARTHELFALAPIVQWAVAVIGATTLLLAGFSALTQWDIKRVLAYSTISQIGYMFLALGVGAWSAAMFHFMTHAFFKALLFLGAGVVIQALQEEHSIFKMGGLRRQVPFTFWTFMIGSCSLAALPVITAGFYSKDLILWRAWSSPIGNRWLWAAGLAGALLTSLYTFRMVFIVFFGPAKKTATKKPGLPMKIPLATLAALSVIGGWVELPGYLGNLPLFSDFIHRALPAASSLSVNGHQELMLGLIAGSISVGGVFLAYLLFMPGREFIESMAHTSVGTVLHRWWFADWGFDWLYDALLVQPYSWLANVDRNDVIDFIYDGIAWTNQISYRALSYTQTGQLRWYAMSIGIGATVIIAMVVFL